MRRLRSTWGIRLLAAVMAFGVVPLVAGPALGGARQAASAPFADGLREQLQAEGDARIEAALEVAVAAQPRSLRAFLETFVEALNARAPGLLADRGSVPSGLSVEATVDHLQRRLAQFASDTSASHTLRAVAGTSTSVPPLSRWAATQAPSLKRPSAPRLPAIVLGSGPEAPFAYPLRLRWAAFPLGP